MLEIEITQFRPVYYYGGAFGSNVHKFVKL